jgi:hypothetical protein
MISYKGNVSATVAIPILGQLLASFDLAGLGAEVAALAQVAFNFTPPTVVGIGAIAAAVTAAIAAGVQPAAIDFKADLIVKYGLLKAKFDLLVQLSGLLAQGSLRVYEYQGAAGSFGPELGATIASSDADGGLPSASGTFAVILLAEGGSAGEATLKILRSGA